MASPSELPVSTLPAEVRDGIAGVLGSKYGHQATLENFEIIAGGCINHGGRLTTSSGKYFVKWNDLHLFPDMFCLEERGLRLLANTRTIRTPDVVAFSTTERYQFIIIEFLSATDPSPQYWQDFGHQLASLHQQSSDTFGLDYDNYIGSLRQFNTQRKSWIEFFIEERITRQLMMAERSGLTDGSVRQKFELLFRKLPELMPDPQPGLVHGDLWSGNLVVDERGNPCILDPAVYYGNPEMEIAYTRLFGAFDERFYAAYDEYQKPQPGFKERIDLYNLYPLLVHTNLFGKKYLTSVHDILNRFI